MPGHILETCVFTTPRFPGPTRTPWVLLLPNLGARGVFMRGPQLSGSPDWLASGRLACRPSPATDVPSQRPGRRCHPSSSPETGMAVSAPRCPSRPVAEPGHLHFSSPPSLEKRRRELASRDGSSGAYCVFPSQVQSSNNGAAVDRVMPMSYESICVNIV